MEYLIEMRLRFVPLSWLGEKWNTSSKEAQVYTLILIGQKNGIPPWMRLRFVPLSWSGEKWNTSSKEAQVYTLILIGQKNGIPPWMRLRFVPLSWSGEKWNTSSKEAQVYTLNLIGRKMDGVLERRDHDGTFGFCTINLTGVFQKEGKWGP